MTQPSERGEITPPHYKNASLLHAEDGPVLENLLPQERKAALATYLDTMLNAERKLIGQYYGDGDLNPYGFLGKMDLRTVYILHRKPYIPVVEIVDRSFPDKESLNILEVGGGDGSNLLALTRSLTDTGKGVQATLTGLNRLPQHSQLEENGVSVATGVIAENLPDEWTQQFDIALSVCSLGWTNLYYSLQGINRVLKPGGIWLGLESYGAPRSDFDRVHIFGSRSYRLGNSLRGSIETTMESLDMRLSENLMAALDSDRNYEDSKPLYDTFGYLKR